MNKLYQGTTEQALALAERFSQDLHEAQELALEYDSIDAAIEDLESYVSGLRTDVDYSIAEIERLLKVVAIMNNKV